MFFDGERIVSRSSDPEHDAARWLRDHGYGGPMETVGADLVTRMRYPDLVATAEWTVGDRRSGGFYRCRHRAYGEHAHEAAGADRTPPTAWALLSEDQPAILGRPCAEPAEA
ncbi:MAG: hypothetical protein WD036_10920 [Bauldia sp.]